jgi:hypothetical protein
MRIIETDSRLVLRDVPTVFWLFGLVFVASGAFVLASPLWAAEWRDFRLRATVTELDRATNRGSQRVRRLWSRWRGAQGAERTEFALGDARAVEIVQSKDSDGDPMYQLRLWLAGSESLWLHAQAVHGGEARVREQAERVRHFLGLDDVQTG